MMSYYLFLDDERMPKDVLWKYLPPVDWQIVRSYDEFVCHILSHGIPKFVAFDHDLADFHYEVMQKEVQDYVKNEFTYTDERDGMKLKFDYGPEKTGFDCAKWLVNYCADKQKHFPEYVVHSLNPVGEKRIEDYIADAKKHLEI